MKLYYLCLAIVLLFCLAFTTPCPWQNVVQDVAPQNATCCVCCRQSEYWGTCVGNGVIVKCNSNNLLAVLQQCKGVDGISFHFDGSMQNFRDVVQKLQVDVRSTQQIGNTVVITGYSKRVSGGLVVDGKLANVQMAFCNGKISVGSPLLLCDY